MKRLCFIVVLSVLASGLGAVKIVDERGNIMTIKQKQLVPYEINYQGWLGNASDTVGITDTLNIRFNLYTTATGGSPVWSELHTNVKVDKGIFNVLLGSINPIPVEIFTGEPLWLEIVVGDQVLEPRKKLVSVGYAMKAANAYQAVYADTANYAIGATNDNDWNVSDNNMYAIPTGKVGIGTTDPYYNAKLHVHTTNTYYGILAEGANSYTIAAEWEGHSLGAAVLARNIGTAGDALQAMAGDSSRSAICAFGAPGAQYVMLAYGSGADWAGYFIGKTFISDNVGIGTAYPGDHRLYVKSSGSGVSGATVYIENTADDGIGAVVENESGDLTLLLSQHGEGDILRCDSWVGGWHPVFKVKNGGNTSIGVSDAGDHMLYVKSAGSGVNGATAYIKNTASDGIGAIIENESSDLTLLLSQHGEGDILRCDSWVGGWHPVFKVENSGKVVCSVLQLTGGSDVSEKFVIKADVDVKPGMVVCIDPDHPGQLTVSTKEYDRKVAGIISGAGGIKPGMIMDQQEEGDNLYPVALSGRVYCWADASYGAIEPGDLLTTSNTPGHAMKVTDYDRAKGAIIGKAMSSLKHGRGLVLVLVTLQ